MAQPYELTATQAYQAILDKSLSPVELVRSLLQRIEAVEPQVLAWETLDAEGALAAAQASQLLLTGGPARGLEGLPFGIKDIIFTDGLRTTASFPPYRDFVPERDAEVIARLRRAGGLVLGKTVTTQFAFADPPRTRNPWHPGRTPGGSSSGSAAAVAARMAPLALGSQTSGSVLRPAGYCGVVGFKPTFGRISRAGVFPLAWTLDHIGVIARQVADVALAYQHLAGYDPEDPGSADREVGQVLSGLEQSSPPRIALITDFLDRAEPAVRANTEATAALLAGHGARIEEIALPDDMDALLAAQQLTQQLEATAVHAQQLAKSPEGYGPMLRAYVEVGSLLPAAAYLHGQRLRRRFRGRMAAAFDRFDVLLTPTATNTAPEPSTTGNRAFQALWSLTGFPSISLPSGRDGDGLPFSVQLAGPAFGEAAVLAAARWCERLIEPLPLPPL